MISAKAVHAAVVHMVNVALDGQNIKVVSYEADEPIVRPSVRIDTDDCRRTPSGEHCMDVSWDVDLYFYPKNDRRPRAECMEVRDALSAAFLGYLEIGDFAVPLTEPLEFDSMNGVLIGSTTIGWTEVLPEEDAELMETLHYELKE